MKRMLAIARKEFLHIIHDPRSLMIIFAMPVIQLILFGYAFNLEVNNIELAVIDYNKTKISRELVKQFEGNDYFKPYYYIGNPSKVEELFLTKEARAILIIGHDFDRKFETLVQTPVQIIYDASDPNAATLIYNYCTQVINKFNSKYGGVPPIPFQIEPRIWYNPDMKSTYFFVPGLVAMILVMISALLTSITLTREKETGTLEQILVSPVRPMEIIVGKVLPYIAMAFLDGFLILAIGIFLFNVPFTGSIILLMFLATLYIVVALSLGLMISASVKTQQVAMMLAISITLLPTVMLSGFMFPIESMPAILQYVTYLVPAKYFIVIIRGIMLKGNTLFELATQGAFLFIMAAVLLRRALQKFSLNLEN
jgi:ABC-2 type transport system permease protein